MFSLYPMFENIYLSNFIEKPIKTSSTVWGWGVLKMVKTAFLANLGQFYWKTVHIGHSNPEIQNQRPQINQEQLFAVLRPLAAKVVGQCYYYGKVSNVWY